MAEQSDLFIDGAVNRPAPITLKARTGDPETSHEAMQLYSEDRMQSAVDFAIAIHRDHGPLADFEYRELFEDRFTELHSRHLYQQARSSARDKGRIRPTSERRINPVSGRKQVVWEVCEQAPPRLTKCLTCGHVTRAE